MEQLQAIIARSDFIPIASACALLVLITIAVYRVRTAPQRAEDRVADLLRDLAMVTQTLSEAEKIGRFGSFTWNFDDQSQSYWSDEMYEIFGLVKRRIPPDSDIFPTTAYGSDRDGVMRAWADAKVKPGPFSFVFRANSTAGGMRQVRVQGTTTLNGDKTLKMIHGVAQDITREMEIDRSKTEFVSLASHQLKTPLTSIRWLVEALLSGSLGPMTPQQQQYAKNIQMSVQRMIDMVNDLLTVSRIELGKMARQIEELDICEIADNVAQEQRHDAEAKKIRFSFTCAPNLPHVFADKISLRHVFQNLISNAIKYTPESGTVKCDLALGGVKGDAIFLTVSDTGIGIPKGEQIRVFEKLHRASNAQALVPDGTGLGLYVVKTVIEKAGGGITFDSTEGKGTTFYATIPIHWKTEGSPIQK